MLFSSQELLSYVICKLKFAFIRYSREFPLPLRGTYEAFPLRGRWQVYLTDEV